MEKIFHGLEHLPEEFHSFRVRRTGTPYILRETNLGQRVIAQCKLPNRDISSRELPDSKKACDRELRKASQAQNELPETEQNTNTKLGKGDQTDAELTDCDHTFSHADSILGVAPERNMQ